MEDLDLGATIKGFSAGQKVFGRYTLKKILGRGGMGVVWLARDEELGRETALKFLPEVVAMDPSAIGDLKREVRRAIELAHPHIVKIHDFVTDGRTAAVSMEFVTGQTLSSQRLDEPGQVFTPEKLGPWVAQLCSALDYAHHDAEVVHRDLKPMNLMIDGRGRLKVLDFGIAASISDSVSRVSNKGSSSGTPVYMSPQQMMGEDAAITDDVYALGATLFELLAGKPPFHAGNIVLQVQNKAAPLLNDRRKTLGLAPVPGEWEQGIAACLAKDPKDRPQSAGEVAERLGIAETRGRKTVDQPSPRLRPTGAERKTADIKVERVSVAIALATAAAPNALSDARPNGLGASRSTSKHPLYVGLAAAVLALGWYFGLHAPEQKRLAEITRLDNERQAKITRMDNERQTEIANRLRIERETWENTLGQKFVPVPGTKVSFCIWETREQDYAAFVSATRRAWKNANAGNTHPAVNVSWDDAVAFCAWLTEKERREGKLGPDQDYRLPTDAEWSVAVGLREGGGTPGSKHGVIEDEYPWGTQWPPPRGAGNYDSSWNVDTHQGTAPVGSFTANRHGLHDLGGNVSERCEDFWQGRSGSRVLRGASFHDTDRRYLASSFRDSSFDNRYYGLGFRVVCAVGSVR